MKVRDILANYPISLAQLKRITQISDIKSDDEVTDYGWGFIDGYLKCEEANNIKRVIPRKPVKKEKVVALEHKQSSTVKVRLKHNIPPSKSKLKKKKSAKKRKRKSVWAISVPMGGQNKWSRKKRRSNN